MKKSIAILLVAIVALTVLSSAGIAVAQPLNQMRFPFLPNLPNRVNININRHSEGPGPFPPHPPSKYHRCPPGFKPVRWVWYNHHWITGCVLRNRNVFV